MKIAIIHGPNLNLLGSREQERYGAVTLSEIDAALLKVAQSRDVEIQCYQSNSEGELVDFIQREGSKVDGIVINPAAYTHTSVAIRDALLAVGTPAVEVHLTNTYAREPFRHRSLVADIVLARLMGFGANSYVLALNGLIDHLTTPE